MFITFRNICATALIAGVFACPLQAEEVTVSSEQLDRMEQRLAELEARLEEQERENKETRALAGSGAAGGGRSGGSILGNNLTYDILADSAWRNLRWTQEEQWEGIRKGTSEEKVIELLGSPPRSLESLKPRIDKVFWYETSLRSRSDALRGKISFKDGKVVYIDKPNFKAVKQHLQSK
ncbi:MAG: hypothetical protein ACOCVJ_00440 [Verrucomicrobiota bacterium]